MKKGYNKSTALLLATRIEVVDDVSQVSQIGSMLEEVHFLRMEKEQGEISLVSDNTAQDTERSEPLPDQEDFFL